MFIQVPTDRDGPGCTFKVGGGAGFINPDIIVEPPKKRPRDGYYATCMQVQELQEEDPDPNVACLLADTVIRFGREAPDAPVDKYCDPNYVPTPSPKKQSPSAYRPDTPAENLIGDGILLHRKTIGR